MTRGHGRGLEYRWLNTRSAADNGPRWRRSPLLADMPARP
jgi:hypothetical protein